MLRWFAAGLAAILLLVGGSIAAIAFLTGEGGGPAAPRPATAERDPAFDAPPPPPPPAPVTGPGVRPPDPPRATARTEQPDVRVTRTAADPWEAIPLTARTKQLGRMSGAIGSGLRELQPRISACFDEVTASRRGASPVSQLAEGSSMKDVGQSTLVLQLESSQGRLRVVDAPVQTRGRLDDAALACIQGVLRGQVLPAPGAVPGNRFRLIFPIQP